MSSGRAVKVWDPLVRLLHWGLVASIAITWIASEAWLRAHEIAGYVALGIVAVRLVWGFVGSVHARFGDFVRRPSTVWRYSVDVARSREVRHLGHNPLGGWMVLALLASVAVTGFSGWLYTTDRFWGLAWVDLLHRTSAWTMVGLIVLHLVGVLFTSLRHRENLVASMLSGRKKP
ncbi:cytochrome b/b6 domain-containing protein [Variovorax sp. RHLX14]|uniref:cytochrome b/b6 domain-containing protein n=1 Tax=Variovorax sp. RHLX14 TaxID=1259731 RepID=UPI003F4493F5